MKKPRCIIQRLQAEDHVIDSEMAFTFIAGYTSGGAPYGVTYEEGGCVDENGLQSSEIDRDWEEYLKEKLNFPFEAEVCEDQDCNYISQGDKLRIHSIEFEDDLYGMIVAVKKGRKKYSVSLIDLEPINLNAQGKIAFEKYKEWFYNK